MGKITCLLLVSFLLILPPQDVKEKLHHYNLTEGIAIQGYDPVSYFIKNKAEKGSEKYQVTYQGVTYYFANNANKNTFLSTPEKFEPQFGGWCAFAMGDYGKKVPVNPKSFKISDGKLYLFYHTFLNNTLESWNKNEVHLQKQADINWNKTLQED